MTEFRSSGDSSSQSILDMLKALHLSNADIEEKRVTVVKFGMDYSSSYSRGSFKIKNWSKATEVSDVHKT